MSINSVTQTASIAARDELRQAHNQLAILTANTAMTSAAIATATVTSQVKTTATLTYLIDGGFQTAITATDNFWTLAGTTVAVASWQKYLLFVNSAGAASVLQGTQSTVSAAAVGLPTMPQSLSLVGVLTVATDATHTFVPGTTLLGATGITATYVNGVDPTLITVVKIGQ
jgi:hypothetical protein